jgi:hypothetical protein
MTAPQSPQPPPGADITAAIRLGNEFASHRAAILTLGIIILAILSVELFREKGLNELIERKQHTAEQFADSAKTQAAKAAFWQSEAMKRAAAVVHDTLRIDSIVEGVPRYYPTDSGMRMVPVLPVPAAAQLDTTLPGQKFGAAVPYAVQPNTQFYTRASDFDSLAAAAARMHRDFDLQIAAMDSGLSHVELGLADETRRGDALTAENTAIRREARITALKTTAVGIGVGIIIKSLIH